MSKLQSYLKYYGLYTVLVMTLALGVAYFYYLQSLRLEPNIEKITIANVTENSYQVLVKLTEPLTLDLEARLNTKNTPHKVERSGDNFASRYHLFTVHKQVNSDSGSAKEFISLQHNKQKYGVVFTVPVAGLVEPTAVLEEPEIIFGYVNNANGEALSPKPGDIAIFLSDGRAEINLGGKLKSLPSAQISLTNRKGIWSFARYPASTAKTIYLRAESEVNTGSIVLSSPLSTDQINLAKQTNNSYEVLGLRLDTGRTKEANFLETQKAKDIRLPGIEFYQSSLEADNKLVAGGTDQTTLGQSISKRVQANSAGCSAANLGACKTGDSCTWNGGWEKICLQPFTDENGVEIKHEWVVYCGLDGKVEAGKYYSQLNPVCTAAAIGQKKNNTILNDLCPDGSGRLQSDPGGCGFSGISTGNNTGNAGQTVGVKFSLLTNTVNVTDSAGQVKQAKARLNIALAGNGTTDTLGNTDSNMPYFAVSLNAGQRLKLRTFYLTGNASVSREVFMSCESFTLLSSNPSLPPPASNIIYGETAPGWVVPVEANGVSISVTIDDCYMTGETVDIGVSPGNLPTGYSNASFNLTNEKIDEARQLFVDADCPIQNAVTIYQSYQGQAYSKSTGAAMGGGGSHSLCSVRSQNPTDFHLNPGDKIFSPIAGTVERILNPIETLALVGAGYCEPEANYYDGGLIMEIKDSSGKLWRLVHLEEIYVKEGDTVSRGQLLATVFDREFRQDYIFEGVNLANYNAKGGCCCGQIHLHFSIIAPEYSDVRDPYNYWGNPINSTAFALTRCNVTNAAAISRTSSGQCRQGKNGINTIPGNADAGFDLLISKVIADDDVVPLNPNLIPPTPGGYTATVNGKEASTPEVFVRDNASIVRFFVDTNNDGVKQVTETYVSYNEATALTVKFAKTSEATNYELNRGWNLIGIPFKAATITKASQLFTEITRGSLTPGLASGMIIATQDSATNFKVFSQVRNQNTSLSNDEFLPISKDFDLIPGQGIFIYAPEPTQFSLTGQAYTDNPARNLWQGWNMLNLYEYKDSKASDLFAKELNITQVARYENGDFRTLVRDNNQTYGQEFNLSPTRSYFVYQD